MTQQTLIREACEICGGQAALAKAVGVSPGMVWQWLTGRRPVPAERCTAIEHATSAQITRAALRPDLWGDPPAPKRKARRVA